MLNVCEAGSCVVPTTQLQYLTVTVLLEKTWALHTPVLAVLNVPGGSAESPADTPVSVTLISEQVPGAVLGKSSVAEVRSQTPISPLAGLSVCK